MRVRIRMILPKGKGGRSGEGLLHVSEDCKQLGLLEGNKNFTKTRGILLGLSRRGEVDELGDTLPDCVSCTCTRLG